MSTDTMNTNLAHGLEMLAAVQTLQPDAASLAAALVRWGCICVPNVEAMLAALAAQGHDTSPAGTASAQRAIVTVWHAAQRRVPGGPPGDPAAWQSLVDLGLMEQAHAAIAFALGITQAGVQRALGGDSAHALH